MLSRSHILGCLALLASTCLTTASPTSTTETTHLHQQRQDARPIYAIAHMVLSASGLNDALNNGANAVEIDVAAWDEGWWADHDLRKDSYGDSVRDMFEAIVAQRNQGRNINFVWLDLKTRDFCSGADCDTDIKHFDDCAAEEKCSIESLQGLAREVLTPAGVNVLFGFFGTEKTRAFKTIEASLAENEAVVLSGQTVDVLKIYNEGDGKDVSKRQRVLDYGYTELEQGFGNCQEEDYQTCAELRNAGDERDRGEIGRVFGWTSTVGQGDLVHQLLEVAGVDGIIYGFHKTRYYDHEESRAAANDIVGFVGGRSDMRMATNGDKPW
ncbi:hypothetical protein FQN55_000549 [Onygenales sp. PD_40]|nr:hypothetical protein FQN55_000549 [Onygenales sp. PD_40]